MWPPETRESWGPGLILPAGIAFLFQPGTMVLASQPQKAQVKAMAPKVRCRDCVEFKGYRCEKRMMYMNPNKPRYCRRFSPKGQATLA